MQITYSFTRIAITVRRWFEIGPQGQLESGARVELGLLTPQPHRGSESAAQPLLVTDTFWRADIFGRLDRQEPGYSAAHFHPRFEQAEPCERTWSTRLTEDPWGWLAAQLDQLEQVLAAAGLDPALAADDVADIRWFAGQIVDTARRFGPQEPLTRDENFRLTKDATVRVRMLVGLVDDGVELDREYLRPWLEHRQSTPAQSTMDQRG